MKLISVMIFGVLGFLSGCSTMNSTFTCNKTASDRCLSIEEVDRMTSFADDYNRAPHSSKFGSKQMSAQKSTTDNKDGANELVWIAPWKDSKGLAHKEQIIQSNQAKA